MGKGLHKLFKTVVKEIYHELTPLIESGSEVPHFIPEPRNFSEVKKLLDNINKPWLQCVIIYVTTLFRSDGDSYGSDIYPVCDVLERNNWRCNYVRKA